MMVLLGHNPISWGAFVLILLLFLIYENQEYLYFTKSLQSPKFSSIMQRSVKL